MVYKTFPSSPLGRYLLALAGLILIIFLLFLHLSSSQRMLALEDLPGATPNEIRSEQWTAWFSIGGLFLLLGGLLAAGVRERIEIRRLGPDRLFWPNTRLHKLLGPGPSARRTWMLALIPGLGQAAAGRRFRAFIMVIGFIPFWALTAWLDRDLVSRGLESGYFLYPILPVRSTLWTGALALTLAWWTAAAADAIRLNRPGPIRDKHFSLRPAGRAVLLSLIPFITGLLCQAALGPLAPVSHPRLWGWGGAVAGLFAASALMGRTNYRGVFLAWIMGFSAGLSFYGLIKALPEAVSENLAFHSLTGGVLVGTTLYLYFRRNGLPALAVPGMAAAAWIGNIATLAGLSALLSHFQEGISPAWLRGLSLFDFYFLGLGLFSLWIVLDREGLPGLPPSLNPLPEFIRLVPEGLGKPLIQSDPERFLGPESAAGYIPPKSL